MFVETIAVTTVINLPASGGRSEFVYDQINPPPLISDTLVTGLGNTSVSEAPEGIPAPGVQLRLVSDAYKLTQAALLRGVDFRISG